MISVVKFKNVPPGRSFFLYNPLAKIFDKYLKYDEIDCTKEDNSFNISLLEADFVYPDVDCILVD